MPLVGAHVSAAGSLVLSLERAQNIGAECTQIFLTPPQRWLESPLKPGVAEKYKAQVKTSGITENFVHGVYLGNLGTQNPEHLQKSISWLTYALNTCGELGIKGVIFHTGSHKGVGFEAVLKQVCQSIEKVLKGSPNETQLILELAAGAGDVIGDNFSELGQILKKVRNNRVKICLDTCHAYASGYDVKTKEALDKTLEELDREVGLNNLVAIHANDSKFDIGSKKDRHANIGEGFIGKEGFENMLNHPKLKDIPFILEVPGFADNGPDKENVDLLKSLRK